MSTVAHLRPAEQVGVGVGFGPDPVEELLRTVADSLAAVLAYLSAGRGDAAPARVEPEADLHEAVARARRRLGLTPREAEVLPLLALGLTNREIADRLVISVKTAEHHVAHILRKLGAPNRRKAAALAHGLLASPAAAPLTLVRPA